MPGTYLDSIEAFHRERAARDSRVWRDRVDTVRYDGASFEEALGPTRGANVKVIAEIKRRSPSRGWLGEHVDAAALAAQYAAGGASAISVLTDQVHFAGSREDLEAVTRSVSVPVLRKDFTVSENDVLDAAEMGAGGVLLIAALLDGEELARYLALALEIGLSPLVEVHDAAEAHVAIDCGSRLIGVNQRNLHSFEVDPDHAASIISELPRDVIRVAESGFRTPEDVHRAADAGFDAVLVGEVFVTSPTPRDLVHEFATVPQGRVRDE